MKRKEVNGKRPAKQGRVLWQTWLLLPVLTLLLALAAGRIMLSGGLPESAMTLVAAVIAAIVTMIASVLTAVRMKEKKMLWGIFTTLFYAAMLLLGNLLFFGVAYGNIWSILCTVLVTGTIGSFVGASRKKKRKYA